MTENFQTSRESPRSLPLTVGLGLSPALLFFGFGGLAIVTGTDRFLGTGLVATLLFSPILAYIWGYYVLRFTTLRTGMRVLVAFPVGLLMLAANAFVASIGCGMMLAGW